MDEELVKRLIESKHHFTKQEAQSILDALAQQLLDGDDEYLSVKAKALSILISKKGAM